jgi:predicted DNA-binding transcriptional regulator YafY
MSVETNLARYLHIVNQIRNKRGTTFSEIMDSLKAKGEDDGVDLSVSKRTFERDLEAIRRLFNIDIRYNFTLREFEIVSFLRDVDNRILESFDILNALNTKDALEGYVFFENRRAKGTEHLHGLLNAIKDQKLIKFEYTKFWEEFPSVRRVEPYALKEYKNRWYLLGKDADKGEIRTFGLDRMSRLETTSKRIIRPDNFEMDKRFKHSFGVIAPEDGQQIEEVVLSFTPFQGKYIKTMPLHESQEILEDNQKELCIRLKIYITHDFIMELHSFSDQVKVLEPIRLANNIINTTKKVLQRYETA